MNEEKHQNKPPFYRLERPDSDKINPRQVFSKISDNFDEYIEIHKKANEPEYLYWKDFKYKIDVDNLKINIEEAWYLVKQFRNVGKITTPIKTESGEYFTWHKLNTTEKNLHKIDLFAGGQLFNNPNSLTAQNKQTYLNRGLIEEAIASSQLEGAHTTRAVARKFLINGKKPSNESEQMIFNNYLMMNDIIDKYKEVDMSEEVLFEMHSTLTKDTVKKNEQNRFRKDKDDIVVQGVIGSDEYITHVPPNNVFIKKEIKKLISYANDENDENFVHPVIKAIFIHFWIGYLHPFTDGNGRLARALFYWYLIKKDYWSFSYIPISSVIKKAPKQYAMAYIYTEQDGLDLTYFYNFNIKKIIQAIEEFKKYLDNKIDENREINEILGLKFELNERQKQLVYYLVSDNNASTSASSHKSLHGISRQTAAKDLKSLEKMKLIYSKRQGKTIKYYPSEKLLEFKK